MDFVLSLSLGIGLAAACGFRVFVPLLGISVAAHAGHLQLVEGMEWMSSWPALICFTTATVLEITAYYVPWLDNLLDTIASPSAVIAGSVATASVVQEMSPFLRWTLALIAGGGVACLIQTGTVGLRSTSSVTTAGLANFVVSTLELVMSVAVTIFSIVMPILTAIVVGLFVVAAWRIVAARSRGIGFQPVRQRKKPVPTQS
jgi:hypothetical protein